MKRDILRGIWGILLCTIGLIGCQDNFDNGTRGFMSEATVTGDSIDGYYCYLDGGGLVVSFDRRLADIERGYFSFLYNETDWTTDNDMIYIRNASVVPYAIYDVIHPLSLEEAENDPDIDLNGSHTAPQLSLNGGCRGYFDLNTGLRIVNSGTGEQIPVKIHLIYNPAEQTRDTLRLQLCYHPDIPDTWSDTYMEYGSISCDISSLTSLVPWNDSVTIVVETADKHKHTTTIDKNDFVKTN